MYSYDRTAVAWTPTPEEEIKYLEEDLANVSKVQAYEDAAVDLGEYLSKVIAEFGSGLRTRLKNIGRRRDSLDTLSEEYLDDLGFFYTGDMESALDMRELVTVARRSLKLKGATQRWERMTQRRLEQLRKKL